MKLNESVDLLSKEFQNNPYPIFNELRLNAPVYWSEQIKAWLVTPYDTVVACLSDSRISANRIIPRILQFPEGLQKRFQPLLDILSLWPLMLDKPDHTRLRILINKAMRNSVITGFIPLIQRLVQELLKKIESKQDFNAIVDLAYPFPLNVLSELIGVPFECRDLLKSCAVDIVNFFGCPPLLYIERAERAMQSINNVKEILQTIINARRDMPQNDLISSLILAKEKESTLSEEEIISICLMMIFAGFETTTNLLGNGLLTLLKHPEELQKLRSNPMLMKNAILEILRFESPVQRLSRMALEDFELLGQCIKKGDLIFLMASSANRDPSQFPNPDRFDITRDASNHLAFGHSIHACPGNTLAQLEAKFIFEALLKRFKKMSLLESEPNWQINLSVRSLNHLHVRFK